MDFVPANDRVPSLTTSSAVAAPAHAQSSQSASKSQNNPPSVDNASGGSSDDSHGLPNTASSKMQAGQLLPAVAPSDVTTEEGEPFMQSALGNAFSRLLSIVQQAATVPVDSPTVTAQAQRPDDALGILLPALPTDVALSFASQYGIDASIYLPSDLASSPMTSQPTILPTNSAFPTATSVSVTASITSTISASSSSSSSSHTITSTSSSTLSTTTRPSSTTSTTESATSTNTAAHKSRLDRGSIAGIATGIVAAFILAALLGLVLLRRRRQGKAMLPFGGQKASQRSRTYPEVAWLYDPSPTPPPRHDGRRAADASSVGTSLLTPTSYDGGAHMSDDGNHPRADPASPLLEPQAAVSRSPSPGNHSTRSSPSVRMVDTFYGHPHAM